jgi:Protein of unknown function (DUF732)
MKRIVVPVWVGIALFCAPLAHADDDADYIATLDHFGIPYQTEDAAIHFAHVNCQMLGQGYSRLELVRLAESDTKVYTNDQVEMIMAASIMNYCPQYKGE